MQILFATFTTLIILKHYIFLCHKGRQFVHFSFLKFCAYQEAIYIFHCEINHYAILLQVGLVQPGTYRILPSFYLW